ncbi:class E sortase [Georgenia sp. 10Sc9-8]|uniref:Class E sortase n=1 Tax=Georgenia halotolerans TaxID=3028317 RepID=A0ABT5TTI0_9MICO|nr:class E sortase [Georgenia halotolerans]
MSAARGAVGGRRGRSRPSLALRTASVLGELLLTVGVLLLLFVVWQLWWTDVIAGRGQDETVAQVREQFAPPSEPAPAAPEPEPGAPPSPSSAPPPEIEPVDPAEVFGIVHVPRWGEDYEVPVAEGVDVGAVFNQGNIGHYPDAAMPGQTGNFALAAHRQSYTAPFRDVEELREGDPVIVETAEGWFVYRVTEDYVVTPDRVDVVAPVPGEPGEEPTDSLLTMTTCHPLYSAAERWITHGEFEEWYPREGGEPTHLMEAD